MPQGGRVAVFKRKLPYLWILDQFPIIQRKIRGVDKLTTEQDSLRSTGGPKVRKLLGQDTSTFIDSSLPTRRHYFRFAHHLAAILRLDLVSMFPRALEIAGPRALPYSDPAVSHIGLAKWD
jgi:hypothetical protein